MRPNSSSPLDDLLPGGVMRSMNVASSTWCHVSYTAMPIITTPRRPTSQRPAGRSNSVDDACCGCWSPPPPVCAVPPPFQLSIVIFAEVTTSAP